MPSMNRILSIPAEQLHVGDRIVDGLPSAYLPGTALDVREPGAYRGHTTPYGCVDICVFGPDPGYPWTAKRLHTLSLPAEGWPLDIDRPNLVIPGLEA